MRHMLKIILMTSVFLNAILIGQEKSLRLVRCFPDLKSEQEGHFLAHPYDLFFDGSEFYITDAVDCCVKVFSKSGEFVRQIGRRGMGPGLSKNMRRNSFLLISGMRRSESIGLNRERM